MLRKSHKHRQSWQESKSPRPNLESLAGQGTEDFLDHAAFHLLDPTSPGIRSSLHIRSIQKRMALIRAKLPARDSGVGPELIFIFLKHSMHQKMLYTSEGHRTARPELSEKPFEKIGPCPFTGTHWPSEWSDKKITPNTS